MNEEEYKALLEWYDTSMIVRMIRSLDADFEFLDTLSDEEYALFCYWYNDVDIRTGAFGK